MVETLTENVKLIWPGGSTAPVIHIIFKEDNTECTS